MTAEAAQQQAEATATKVAALLAAYEAGQIAAPDLSRAVAVAVYAGKVTATRLADIHVSTIANLPPLGILPGPQHIERLTEAAETALSEPESAPERLALLAEAETLSSHGKSLRAAITGHGFDGFREDVAEDACEVCQPFRDQVHEAEEDWSPHHPRCRCSLVPVGDPKPRQEPEEAKPEPLPLLTFSSKQVRRIA